MKKFISLTAVCYSEDGNGKTFAEELKIIIDAGFINGFTDAMLPEDDFDMKGISKAKYQCEGSKVFLNKKGQKFFDQKLFSTKECNGCISDACFFVTEEFDDIKKQLLN